jgi:hypothetical protein
MDKRRRNKTPHLPGVKERAPAAAAAAWETIMKAPQYIIGAHVLASAVNAATLVLTADTASAARYLPRRHASEHSAPQHASPGDLYESLANGRQPYQNPDRQLYLPD